MEAPKRDSPKYDKLFKLRPVLDLLNQLFKLAFSLPQYLSIDEMMIAFKGRNSMKQYIQNKPIKRGFKVWGLFALLMGRFLGWKFTLVPMMGKKKAISELGSF